MGKDMVPHMFLIGQKSKDEDYGITNRLKMEIETYSDFIIGNYTDTYQNLTYKTLSAYEYVNDCDANITDHVVLQDDDSFLNIENALEVLRNDPKLGNITCYEKMSTKFRPHRIGKWKISFDQWSAGFYFPDFCAGPCTGITKKSMAAIYRTGTNIVHNMIII